MDLDRRNLIISGLAGGLVASAPGRLLAQQGAAAGPAGAASPRPTRVLVAGATGEIGRYVVADLVAAGIPVRGLTRNPAAARAAAPRAEWVAGDLREPDSLKAALNGVDAVVFAAGWRPTDDPSNTPRVVDYGGVANLAELARESGAVRRFVLVSSAGVTRPPPPGFPAAIAEVIRWKARAELALKVSGVPYTIIRPYGLSKAEPGQLGVLFLQGDLTLPTVVTVGRQDLAAVAAAAASEAGARGLSFELLNAATMKPDAWRGALARLQPD